MNFLVWILAIAAVCVLLNYAWLRVFRGFLRQTPTMAKGDAPAFRHVFLRALLTPGVGRGADFAWVDYGRQAMERRLWLLSLAVSSTSGLLFAILPAVIVYQTSMQNVFLGLSQLGMLKDPPQWIFWLADGRMPALFQLAAVGAFFGIIFRSPYLVGTLTWILLFPNFVSFGGFIALQLGERWGMKLWRIVRFGRSDGQSFKDWGLSFLVQTFVLILALGMTAQVQDVIAGFMGGDSFHAFWRFVQAMFLLWFWVGVELGLALVIFHFYALRKSA